jgi:hypothetical protein
MVAGGKALPPEGAVGEGGNPCLKSAHNKTPTPKKYPPLAKKLMTKSPMIKSQTCC